ncbi:MAG: hypothetical protein FD180_288 [Planctomycetota bacterium]|nr:MAG: hypothetical protein FD180_288 [Planctomycetota bacterium]
MESREDFGNWLENEFRRLTAEGVSPQEAMPLALEHAKALAVKQIGDAVSNPRSVEPGAIEKAKREAEQTHQVALETGADPALRAAANPDGMKKLEARGRAIEEEMKEFGVEQGKKQEARSKEITRLTEEGRLASELAGERARSARLASLVPHQVLELWKSLQSP